MEPLLQRRNIIVTRELRNHRFPYDLSYSTGYLPCPYVAQVAYFYTFARFPFSCVHSLTPSIFFF